MKNTVTISDGALHIPQMEIRSSALNTYIGGTHYFNGDFNYNITLFFSELLRSKAQKLENPIKEGKTKVFLTAVQRNGKLTIDYATDIGKNVKAIIQKEQKALKEAQQETSNATTGNAGKPAISIDHEFSSGNADEPAATTKEEKPKPEKKKEKSAVNIEWDD
jgi:hypothetical protein